MKRRLLGLALILAGIGGAAAVLLFSGFRAFDSLLRVEAPGSAEADLEAGHYTVYWESLMLAREGFNPPAVGLSIESKPDGWVVPVSGEDHWGISYSTDKRGTSIAGFTIPAKGVYLVKVLEPKPRQEVSSRISIARALDFSALVRLAGLPFCLFWGGVLSGAWLLFKRPKAA